VSVQPAGASPGRQGETRAEKTDCELQGETCPVVGEVAAEAIRVTGTVQGVGFRPMVYRLATQLHLRGTVLNDGEGVLIRVAGSQSQIDQLVAGLLHELPPLAKISCIKRHPIAAATIVPQDFRIDTSVVSRVRTEISPDAATCPACQREIFDASSRFFRYPFTNCTHCGPRLSIIQSIPYDRGNTSMGWFTMCPSCQRDYEDVTNRRFHAQPTACPTCGPKVWLERADGKPVMPHHWSMIDEADAVCALIKQGEIVAIKGLSGVHLACDATNEAAVSRLRQRKHRYHKPFALMVRDPSMIQPYCTITPQEKALLASPAAPIVLLQRRGQPENDAASPWADMPTPPPVPPSTHPPTSHPLAPSVAPGMNTLGVMLPYTPLHHLIFQRLDRPVVMTSGNRSDEPQCISNEEVRATLGDIATYFLLHNRDIVNRLDDSVMRVVEGQPQLLRRARGYAPAPIALPPGFEAAPQVLAMGGELKNTFCCLRLGQAILSQHLGDLENAAAHQSYRQTLGLYQRLFDYRPTAIAVDLHPEYLSTKLGQQWVMASRAAADGHQPLPLRAVQHHHAHIAACMADNGLPIDVAGVLGIALDGLGYGEDGTLWGGEFLLADYRHCQRLAHLKPMAMIGGEQAIRQPWRNTYVQLLNAYGSWQNLAQEYPDLPLVEFLAQQPHTLLAQILNRRVNAPLTSSAGRLFDAIAAALGLCRQQATYEGQGAIEMEALIEPHHWQSAQTSAYGFEVQPIGSIGSPEAPLILDPAPLWPSLLRDLRQSVSIPLMAARFHVGFGDAIANLARQLAQQHQLTTVALSGGVFQNQWLTTQVRQRLTQTGLEVLTHRQVPTNDGGLSLGQAVVAAARELAEP
jgi:hydrogenase maturation protein HypF